MSENQNTIHMIYMQLKVARDFYYKGKPIMTDPEFDELETKLRELDPTHIYFTTVGTTDERGKKVKHTIPMGSLNQVDEGELNTWMKKYDSEFIFSDKLDGNSIAIYYGIDGEIEAAVTRGDGVEGLDITRHIRRIINSKREERAFPSMITISSPLVVRCEAIFKKELFEKHVTGYKNPRNYVAGQLNRTLADQTFIDYVDIVAFDADLPYNKHQLLDTLKRHGFNVVNYSKQSHIDDAEIMLNDRKAASPYELDGIVVDVDNLSIRSAEGFHNLNPNYAVKFKINQNFIDTEVVEVEWNPSKDGYLKPRVQFEPIDLAGVTISFATGFNAKFIQDNNIGPGAIVRVTRSGDVIPYLQEVITPAQEPSLPEDYEDSCVWSDTGVDLILKEKPDESHIKEIVEFFTSIDAPVLKMGNVTTLYEAGFTTIAQIIAASEDDLVVILGENGSKAYMGLKDKLSNIDEYTLAGSLPFFGRGVGKRKMKVLAEMHGDISTLTYDQIINTPGFDEITAVKVANAIPFYVDFITDLSDYIGVKKFVKIQGDLNNVAVCFTGVRDKQLEQIIESRGGKVLSSAGTQMTHLVAKDPNGKSGKLDKARSKGVEIISLDDAKARWSN